MESLLIGGAQSVGKSTTIYRLTNRLISKGFTLVSGTIPVPFNDFRVVIEGSDKNGKTIRIIINSPSDTVNLIRQFKHFYDSNGIYDILISSIRDDNFYPRADFFSIMQIIEFQNTLEIPLGKITRRGTNFSTALNWYEQRIDKLIDHTLSNPPFNL